MTPPLGIIEGYYGIPWTWQERAAQASFLAPHGYSFYLYAPKADPYLRRRWREPHPDQTAQHLKDLATHCAAIGVGFGVGLTPLDLHQDFDTAAREDLKRKLAQFAQMGVTQLGVLFDDMRGDQPGVAEAQGEIVGFIGEHTTANRIITCPSYYTDDPVLDRLFGQRPADYLQTLGRVLDPAVEVFWTGEEVCSREYSPGHLARVSEELGRKPTLWDNYPVNDGPNMSQRLHIRAFTGRPAAIAEHVAAHAINPALQPVLTRIPALTLKESYETGAEYQYGQAWRRAAEAVLGADRAHRLQRHLGLLNDTGLDNIAPDTAERMREQWSAEDHPAALEILKFLSGGYRFSREDIDAQAFG